MLFDSITLILGIAVIVLAVLTPFCNPFKRNILPPTTTEEEQDGEDLPPLPPLSVLITVQHKQAQMLARHLPLFLNQDYPTDYEVIVVAEKGDSDTEDVINANASNPHLYATYVPQSSRYMSRKKLAITLGVKASHNEWIALTDASYAPSGDHWLRAIACHCAPVADNQPSSSANLVVGYSNYDNEAPSYYRFEHLRQACYTIREARRGTVYRAMGGNVAFRKSDFISGDGFRGNLQDTRGEYDFLVNKYARKHLTRAAIERQAWTIADAPTQHAWRSRHLYDMHTRKHLARGFRHQLLPWVDELTLHLCFLAILGTGIFAAITNRWILLGIAIAALLITVTMRTVMARKVLKAYEEEVPTWLIYPYELSGIWHHLRNRLRYWRANKTDFTSHKV